MPRYPNRDRCGQHDINGNIFNYCESMYAFLWKHTNSNTLTEYDNDDDNPSFDIHSYKHNNTVHNDYNHIVP